MELDLKYVPFDATRYDVIRALEKALHGPDLFDPNDVARWPRGRPPNFQVKLEPSVAGGVGNNGKGTLTLHSRKFGERFLRWLREEGNSVKVLGKKLYIKSNTNRVLEPLKDMLDKSIYVG